MVNSKRILKILAIGAILAGLFNSCDNPFDNSLGKKVNIRPPVITMTSPMPGSYIKGEQTFTGTAKDDRAVIRIEVGIFSSIDAAAPSGWNPIPYDGSENWSYTIDTTTLNNGKDGSIKLQFRAFNEVHEPTPTTPLVYIIKNQPPDISITTPDVRLVEGQSGETEVRLPTGSRIRGIVTDRQGVKPGYPMIKFWKVTAANLNAPDWGEPPDDDPNLLNRWNSMNITGYAKNDLATLGKALDMLAVEFPLVERTVVSNEINYTGTPLQVESLGYRFRIKASDYVTYPDANGIGIEAPAEEKLRYFPVQGDPPVHIILQTANELPKIMPDNRIFPSLLTGALNRGTTAISAADLAKKPHIYIDDTEVYKIGSTNPADTVFKLIVKITHSSGIIDTQLKWREEGTSRQGILTWDDGDFTAITNPPGYPERGIVINPGTDGQPDFTPNDDVVSDGKWFVFTLPGGDTLDSGNRAFRPSANPYVLEVTATATSSEESKGLYYVYIDDEKPNLAIDEIVGAYDTPAGTGGSATDCYTVNGVIQVKFSPSDSKSGLSGVYWKWVTPGNVAALDSAIATYQDYSPVNTDRHDPAFLQSILGADAISIGTASSFIANTTQKLSSPKPASPVTDEYIYVFALDKAYNLNSQKIRMHIDQKTDIPGITAPENIKNVIETSALPPTAGSDYGNNLEINMSPAAPNTIFDETTISTSGNVGGADGTVNVLVENQRMEFTLKDNNGLDLGASGRTSGVKLWIYNLQPLSASLPAARRQVPDATVKQIFPYSTATPARPVREITGQITQEHLATAYSLAKLPDGIYRLEMEVTDSDKLGSTAAVSYRQFFWFAVSTTFPKITIDSPAQGESMGTGSASDRQVNGTVESRNKIQGLWVKKPKKLSTENADWKLLQLYADAAYNTPATAAIAPDNTGLYKYYWRWESTAVDGIAANTVRFDDGDNSRMEKTFTVRAADRFYNTTTETRTVVVDTRPPTVKLLNLTRLAEDTKINGVISITISGADETELSGTVAAPGIKYWIMPSTFDPAVTPLTWTTPLTGGPSVQGGLWPAAAADEPSATEKVTVRTLSALIDTRDTGKFTPGATYTIFAMSQDKAGNNSLQEAGSVGELQKIQIEQDTDFPVALAPTVYNISGVSDILSLNGLKIRGTITDDDGFVNDDGADPDRKQFVTLTFTDDQGDALPWTPAGASTVPSAYTINADLQGDYTISYVIDVAAFAATFTEPASEGYKYFRIDGPKYYTITAKDYLPRKQFKNSAGDVVGSETQLTRTYPKDVATGTVPKAWNFSLDNDKPVIYFNKYDPNYESRRDAAGTDLNNEIKGYYTNTTLYPPTGYDHKAGRPTYKEAANMAAEIGGLVWEANIDTLHYTLGGSPVSINYADTTIPNVYRWSIPAANLGTDFNSRKDGPVYITLEVTDKAKNKSTAEWLFYKDQTGPRVNVTSINPVCIPVKNDFVALNPAWPSDWPSASETADWKAWPADFKAQIAAWNPSYAGFNSGDAEARYNQIVAAIKAETNTANAVSVIYSAVNVPGKTDVFTIRGSFTDEYSKLKAFDSLTASNYTWRYRFRPAATNIETINTSGTAQNDRWETPEFAYIDNTYTTKVQTANNGKNASWYIQIPTPTGYPTPADSDSQNGAVLDGLNVVDIEVIDALGNETKFYGLAFKIDRKPPEFSAVTVAHASALNGYAENVFSTANGGSSTTVFTLSGTVTDENISVPIKYRLGADPAKTFYFITTTPPTTEKAHYNPTTKVWTLNITGDDLVDASYFSGGDDQQQTITIIASDEGQRETAKPWDFYRDETKPSIEFNNMPHGESGVALEKGTAAFGSDPDYHLSGSAYDANKIKSMRYNISKRDYTKTIGAADAWQNWDPDKNGPGQGGWDAAYTPPVSNWPPLLAANYGQSANPALTTVNWDLNLKEAACFKTAGGYDFAEGQYRIELFAEDYSYHSTSSLAGNAHTTNNNGNNSYNDNGLTGTDAAVARSPRIFYIDNAPPVVTPNPVATAPYYGVNASGALILTGKVRDPNLIQNTGSNQIQAWIGNKKTSTPPPVITLDGSAADTTDRSWSVTFPAGYFTSAPQILDGSQEFNLKVTDGAGRVNDYNYSFTLDTTPPTGKITSPDPATIVTGEVRIDGDAEDDGGKLQEVFFAIGAEPTTANVTSGTSTGWQQANLTTDNGWFMMDGIRIAKLTGDFTWHLTIGDLSSLVRLTPAADQGRPNAAKLAKTGPYNAGPSGEFDGVNISGKPLYKINVWIRAADQAGNVNDGVAWKDAAPATPYELIVYPDGDYTTVKISNPDQDASEGNRVVGGNVTVYGRAADNDWVQDVIYRVLEPNSRAIIPLMNDVSNPRPVNGGYTLAPGDDKYNDGATPNGGWYAIDSSIARNRNCNFYFIINQGGELNPGSIGERRQVVLQIAAFDAEKDADGNRTGRRKLGYVREMTVFFELGVPQFGVERILPWELMGTPGTSWTPSDTNNWDELLAQDISQASMKGRATYRVSVMHESGLSNLRWRNSLTGSWKELLTVDPSAYYTGLQTRLTSGGIDARAEPKGATNTMTPGNWYLIVEMGTTTKAQWQGLDADTSRPASEYAYLTTFKAGAATVPGTGKVIPAVDENGNIITGDGVYNRRFYPWDVIIDVDTDHLADPSGGNYAGKAKIHDTYLEAVSVTKPNPQSVYKTVEIPVDYFYPRGWYTGNARMAGTSYTVQGAAVDTASGVTLGGVRKVVAWFQKGSGANSYYKFADGSTYSINTASGGANEVKAVRNRTAMGIHDTGGTPANGETFDLYLPDLTNGQALIIDRQDPNGTSSRSDGNGGVKMNIAQSGNEWQWWAQIDSNKMPDGPLTIHYAVYDFAGNISYYTQRLVNINKAPLIKQVTLGTDLYGDFSPSSTTSITNPGTAGNLNTRDIGAPVTIKDNAVNQKNYNMNFKVRNNLMVLKVEMTANPAVANRTYRLQFVSGETTGVSASALTKGEIYTIATLGGTNWEALGAPANFDVGTTFLATATKADGIVVEGTGTAISYTLIDAGQNFMHTQQADNDGVEFVVYNPSATLNAAGNAFGTNASTINDNPSRDVNRKFLLKVYDGPETDDFADYAMLHIDIFNNDISPPEARLWDLNPKAEPAASTLEAAATPTAMGSNYNRGGIYYVGGKKAGHIEPRKGDGTAAQRTQLTSAQMGGAAGSQDTGTYSPTNPSANPDYYFAVDTVSGKVILRGYAEDDIKVSAISLSIDGATAFPIITSNSPPAVPSAGQTGLLGVAAGQTDKVYFIDTIDLNRHRVEWAYIWDTETIPATVVKDNVSVQVTADNSRSTADTYKKNPTRNWGTVFNNNGTTAQGAGTYGQSPQRPIPYDNPTTNSGGGYNQITVNIRPYITALERDSKYDTDRSRNGWYSFARGETITIRGFNLKASTGDTTVTMPKYGSTTDLVSVTAGASSTKNTIIFTVPGTAGTSDYTAADNGDNAGSTAVKSGLITLKANSLEAVNTAKPKVSGVAGMPVWIQPWNRENSGSTASALWDDYTNAHVWQSNSYRSAAGYSGRLNAPQSRALQDPAMTVDGSGNITGSYAWASGKWVLFNQKDNATVSDPTDTINTGDLVAYSGTGYQVYWDDFVIQPDVTTTSNKEWTAFAAHGRFSNSNDWNGTGGIFVLGPNGAISAANSEGTESVLRRSGIQSSFYIVEKHYYNANNAGAYSSTASTEHLIRPHVAAYTLPNDVYLNASYAPYAANITGATTSTGTKNNVTQIHVSYYDTLHKTLKYRYNQEYAAAARNADSENAALWTNIDGGIKGLRHNSADGRDDGRFDTSIIGAIEQRYNINAFTGSTTDANNTVRKVYKNTGDYVNAGDPLVDVGTAAGQNTLKAYTSGTIQRIAPVGAVLNSTNNDNNTSGDWTSNTNWRHRNNALIATIQPQSRVVPDANFTGSSRSTSASEYSAIAVTSDGKPVIVYYDADTKRLRMAYTTQYAPIEGSAWTVKEVLPTTNIFHDEDIGQYVSMKIDSDNRIHIAAYNADRSALMYITGTWNATTGIEYVDAVIVDSTGSVGVWTSIAVNGTTPWITYQDLASGKDYSGYKVAVKDTYFGKTITDATGKDIKGWEIMAIPSRYAIEAKNNKPTIGVTSSKFWTAAVGYLENDANSFNQFRLAYYVKW